MWTKIKKFWTLNKSWHDGFTNIRGKMTSDKGLDR